MAEAIRFPALHLIRALPSAGRLACAAFLLQAVVAGLTAPLSAIASGLLISALVRRVDAQALLAAATLGGLFALAPVLGAAQGLLGNHLGLRLSQQFRDRIMAAALEPTDLTILESPGIADLLASAMRLEQEGMPMREVVIRSGGIVSQRVRAVAMAAVLAAYLPWAGPLLLVAALVSGSLVHQNEYTEAERSLGARVLNHRGDYYESLAIGPPAAKEIRIFGLGEFFADRLASLREQFYDRVRQARNTARKRQLLGIILVLAPAILVLRTIAQGALAGQIGAASLAVQLQAVFGLLGYSGDDSWIQRGGMAAARVNTVESTLRSGPARRSQAPLPAGPPSISFENVTFTYPGSDHPVLRDLDLEIPAGRSLALVGLNGAGKTTLIKLLAGLYRPQAGRILIGGVDQAEVGLESWWARLAIVFQDFLRLELSARENVAFDRGNDCSLRRAAHAAALESVVARLPRGWETTLSRAYDGGSDLSGGEWQRVALARMLHAIERGAQVVVLDEPTAHLDIRAEAETFQRILHLTRGLTTVLVSHRYSTVRHADTIAVLEAGRLVETGPPTDLLARPSRYAAMFRSHRRLAEASS